MTEMITITFGDASTLALPVYDGTLIIDYRFDGLEVSHQPNKVGITNDPNTNYRKVECTSWANAATVVDTIDVKVLPAVAPTYDATDPKIVVNLSGAKSITMLCAITECKVSHLTQDNYQVKWTFEGRTL